MLTRIFRNHDRVEPFDCTPGRLNVRINLGLGQLVGNDSPAAELVRLRLPVTSLLPLALLSGSGLARVYPMDQIPPDDKESTSSSLMEQIRDQASVEACAVPFQALRPSSVIV